MKLEPKLEFWNRFMFVFIEMQITGFQFECTGFYLFANKSNLLINFVLRDIVWTQIVFELHEKS